MNVALVQVQEGVQPLVNTANFIFIDPATVEQPILPAFTPIVLPPERPVFAALPDKPPDIENAAIRFLNNLNGKFDVAVINSKSSPVIHDADGIKVKPLEKKIFIFSLRPLQRLVFGERVQLHHSIITQIDGLPFACFRLRLERDVCATSSGASFCTAFGVGHSPASTFWVIYAFPLHVARCHPSG